MKPASSRKKHKTFPQKLRDAFFQKKNNVSGGELEKLALELEREHLELERKTHELEERTKELSLYYQMFNLATQEEVSEDEFLQELTNLIPSAWQYPKNTCARIVFKNRNYQSPGFRETKWRMAAEIRVNKKPEGTLEVFYTKKMPEEDKGPFLKEEKNLLNTVAQETGLYFERRYAITKLEKNRENLQITLNSIGDAVIATDVQGKITSLNPVAETLTGWKYNDARGQKLTSVFKIVNAYTGKQVENPVKKVLETGEIVGLANHTKLISKNGNEYQIADSAAPIKNNEGETLGVVLVFRDVTEEYRLKDSLEASEEKYRMLIENQTDLVVKTDTEGRFLFVSPSYCNMFGKKENELLGRKFMPMVHDDDREKTAKAMEALNKPPHTAYVEQRALTPNGWKWLAWNDTAIVDESGNLTGIVGVGRDISRQKEAETKLLHSHELLQYIVEHTNSAVAVFDRDMKYIYVSRKYKEDYRVGNMDLIGKKHYDVFPELTENKLEAHRKAMQGIVSKNDRDSYVHPNGFVEWVKWEVRPWHEMDGSIGGVILYAEHITEQVNAEEKLKESRRMLSSMIENLPGFVYRCKYDKNWTMLHLSSQFEKITGYPVTDFIENSKCTFNDIIVKEFQPGLFEKWDIAVKKSTGFDAEYKIKTADGKTRWVNERGNGVYDTDGNVLFLEGYIEDITPRRESEEAFRNSEKKYRQITENMSDVVWTTDINFKTIYVSRSIERLMGESIEKHLQKNIEEKFPPASWEKLQNILYEELELEKNPEADKKRTRKVEVEHYKADGSLIWVEMNISFIRNEKDEIIGYQGVTRDISNRKKAETELKQKVDELERFNRAMINRENKMIELKHEINELLEKLGQNKKYRIPGENEKD